MRAALVAVTVATACGRRDPEPRPAPAPATIDAAAPRSIDAAAPRSIDAAAARSIDAGDAGDAGPPPPDSPELRAAVAAIDEPAVASWMFDTRARAPDAGVPAPPAVLAAAITALLAWDRDGAAFAVGCADQDDPRVFPHLADTARAALAFAGGVDDVRVHAVLHLAQALRDARNAPLAIDVGTQLARDAAGWLVDHGVAPTDDFTAFAPEPDAIERDVRAGQRCALERGARAGGSIAALRAYCDENARLLLAAHGADAIDRVILKREPARPAGPLHDAAADCRGDEAAEVAAAAASYAKQLERARKHAPAP